MTQGKTALLRPFSELLECGFSLGVEDYLSALQALAGTVRVTSREELIFTCCALWGKTREEQEWIADVLHASLPYMALHKN